MVRSAPLTLTLSRGERELDSAACAPHPNPLAKGEGTVPESYFSDPFKNCCNRGLFGFASTSSGCPCSSILP